MPALRTCKSEDCELEAAPRRQLCEECWIAKQPPVKRAELAQRRLSLIPESARRKTIERSEWPKGRRWCAGCQTFVRMRDCTGSRCKACASIASHKSRTKSVFGIDDETYQWLLLQQGGKCAICRAKPASKRMSIDHDHEHCKSGCPECVRGLLCARCNHELLGAAHDSLNILRAAVTYLETPPMSGEWQLPQWEVEAWEAKYGDASPPAPF